MNLIMPVTYKDKVYTQIETKHPKNKTLSEAHRLVSLGRVFSAITEFLAGCIEKVICEDGSEIIAPAQIKAFCRQVPYIVADVIIIKMLSNQDGMDDVIEGLYKCPKCGVKINSSDLEEKKISDLKIKEVPEGFSNEIIVNLSEPVIIKNVKTGEILEEIETFTIKYPTLKNCESAGNNTRKGREVDTQLKIYCEAMVSVNWNPIDSTWKTNYGTLLFDNMRTKDIKQIGDAMRRYGIDNTIDIECYECGKVWKEAVNTSSFFVSGLQSV